MNRRWSLALIACLASACSAPPVEETSAVHQQRVIGGMASTATDDAVMLVLTNRDVTSVCSGALIAPNLLLTARHCVAAEYPADDIHCNPDGTLLLPSGGQLGVPVSPEKISLFVGVALAGTPFPTGTPAAIGQQVITGDGPSVCRDDLALVVLDHALDQAPIQLGLGLAVVQAGQVSVVGYGLTEVTDPEARYDTRHRRDGVAVKYVGLLPNTFTLGRSVCKGDSGGPALDATTGALLGVYSLGFPGKDAADCSSDAALNYFVDVGRYEDLLRQGFSAAGQPFPEPIVADEGAEGGLGNAGAGAVDDAGADDAGATGGGGGQPTQAAGSTGSKPSTGGGGGCQVRGLAASSNSNALLFAVALVGLATTRRARRKLA